MIYLKFLCLMVGVMFFYTNTFRGIKDQGVPLINILLMSAGIAGFICLQFLV